MNKWLRNWQGFLTPYHFMVERARSHFQKSVYYKFEICYDEIVSMAALLKWLKSGMKIREYNNFWPFIELWILYISWTLDLRFEVRIFVDIQSFRLLEKAFCRYRIKIDDQHPPELYSFGMVYDLVLMDIKKRSLNKRQTIFQHV